MAHFCIFNQTKAFNFTLIVVSALSVGVMTGDNVTNLQIPVHCAVSSG